jgi:hypothetical protein
MTKVVEQAVCAGLGGSQVPAACTGTSRSQASGPRRISYDRR